MKRRSRADGDGLFAPKKGKSIPHAFVLDAIERLAPYTKPMFGCLAIYVDDKICFILRDRESSPSDNGVWVATMREHHESLRKLLPSLRSIDVLGTSETHWQVLPADGDDFEREALYACALVLEGDPRIGKIPKRRTRAPKPPPGVSKKGPRASPAESTARSKRSAKGAISNKRVDARTTTKRKKTPKK